MTTRQPNAEIFADSLYSEESMNRINEWCSDKTKGMIYPFLKDAPSCDIVLLNALYFKGRGQICLIRQIHRRASPIMPTEAHHLSV